MEMEVSLSDSNVDLEQMDSMDDFNPNIDYKEILKDSLGPDVFSKYQTFMMELLSGNPNSNVEEFQENIRGILNPEQLRLHDMLVISILKSTTNLDTYPTDVKRKFFEYYTGMNKKEAFVFNLTQVDPFAGMDRALIQSPWDEFQRMGSDKGFVPDKSVIDSKISKYIWEYDLEGIASECSAVIAESGKMFVKNIVEAIITNKCGFKTNNALSIVHAYDSPVPNPWLRNTLTQNKSFLDGENKKKQTPLNMYKQKIISELGCTSFSNGQGGSRLITVNDIILAFQMYPSLVPNRLCLEKLQMARMHPSMEDMEGKELVNSCQF